MGATPLSVQIAFYVMCATAILAIPLFLYFKVREQRLSWIECAFGVLCALIWLLGHLLYFGSGTFLQDIVNSSIFGMYFMMVRYLGTPSRRQVKRDSGTP